jgi:uroporphyrinogen-III decarboxylase
LIEILVDASVSYLVRQFTAGVDAVQIFDTWAGILPAQEFEKLVHQAACADHVISLQQQAILPTIGSEASYDRCYF